VESRLGSLGTSATEWPIVPAPSDYEDGEFGGRTFGRGNRSTLKKTCPSTTLSSTNPTWPDPGLNPGRRGGKPATNRLSYGAACAIITQIIHFCEIVDYLNQHSLQWSFKRWKKKVCAWSTCSSMDLVNSWTHNIISIYFWQFNWTHSIRNFLIFL
jgi:hypothetical protein